MSGGPPYRELENIRQLIEIYGLDAVLGGIADICEAKGVHMASHAANTAKRWLSAGADLRAVATKTGDL